MNTSPRRSLWRRALPPSLTRSFRRIFAVAAAGVALTHNVAHAYTHPCMPLTAADIATLNANKSTGEWATGYAAFAADWHSQLGYVPQGPFVEVGRNPNVNLNQWRNDMKAIWALALQWKFTGDPALLAFREIEARGYLRIGFVTGGWAGALVKAGALFYQSELPRDRQIPLLAFEEANATWEARYPRYVAALDRWMKENKPDAIFTDVGELRKLLSDAGYAVPKDVALAGYSAFDGDADAGIDQNAFEIGRAGALLMVSLINTHDRGVPAIPREILIPGKWVDGSTLPPRRETCV